MMSRMQCLSTSDTLRKIQEELKVLLQDHDSPLTLQDFQRACLLSPKLLWSFLILSLTCSFILIASPTTFGNTQVCGILLLFIIIINLIFAVLEALKKKREVITRLRSCVSDLTDVQESSFNRDCLALSSFEKLLKTCDTAALLRSPSHSVSKVIKSEDGGEVVRYIPTSLLVAGDQILLYPGQAAPASAILAEDKSWSINRGSVFDPSNLQMTDSDETVQPVGRFQVTSTPIIEDIKNYVNAHKVKEATIFERQREYILRFLLNFVIPTVLILSCIVGVLRIMFVHGGTDDSNKSTANFTVFINNISIRFPTIDHDTPLWYTYFLQLPALLCFPLFPFYFHMLCTVLVTIGEAKTMAVYRSRDFENAKYVAVPNTLTMSSQAIAMGTDNIQGWNWWNIFRKLLCGSDGTHFHRNAGLFLPMGSLTVLCCLDKEGILSWLNPITEKVFFFKHASSLDAKEKRTGAFEAHMPVVLEDSVAEKDITDLELDETLDSTLLHEDQGLVPETLSLSQDSYDPSYVRFDDVNWKNHHSSLKAIGLNILLNLCSCTSDQQSGLLEAVKSVRSIESAFLNRVQQEQDEDHDKSANEEILHFVATDANCLPTGMRMARKGLCDLAEIIGISQSVKRAYSTQKIFTAYRKLMCKSPPIISQHCSSQSPDPMSVMSRRNKWRHALPHFHGVICEDLIGDKQLLVYGTGDMIIEHCKEVWDGQQVHVMTSENRRRALDFYQRSSVAGQCIAFAYSPVISNHLIKKKIAFVNLSNMSERKSLYEDLGDEDVLDNLIFLGMSTLQHQAKYAVCHMVDALDHACIRFVHFSAENEVRSRVFAEKMGLETGWNCHISLSPTANEQSSIEAKTSQSRTRSGSFKSRTSSETAGQNTSKLTDGNEDAKISSAALMSRTSPRTQSESSTTDSLFNVPNRAKLPRGIENIVPHIENFDNVPLLVPLFTDCSPESAGEMIKIMKKYGEVVCCIGSSDCIRNTSVFPVADVSISIEPLLQPMLKAHSEQSSLIDHDLSSYKYSEESAEAGFQALEVARKLNSFSCSALLSGDNGLPNIMNMILQARHFLFLIRTFFIFLGKCEMTLILLQLLTHFFLLPSLLTPMDVFWFGMIVFPCLSLSLFGSPPDEDLMTWANEKSVPHQNPVRNVTIRYTLKKYLVKFIPSVLVLVLCYFAALQSSCMEFSDGLTPIFFQGNLTNYSNASIDIKCYPTYMLTIDSGKVGDMKHMISWSIWDSSEDMKKKFRAIQMTVSGFLLVYICVISLGFVHRWKKITDALPFTNKFWWIMVLFLIAIQMAITAIALYGTRSTTSRYNAGEELFTVGKSPLHFGSWQIAIWSILTVWTVPCTIFNELWKWREINLWNRWQKRARLNFGTKLGMNSPF